MQENISSFLFENSSDAIFLSDAVGNIIEVNNIACKIIYDSNSSNGGGSILEATLITLNDSAFVGDMTCLECLLLIICQQSTIQLVW